MIEIIPHVQLYEKAMRHAFITVFDSYEKGFKPRFGGGVIQHFIGKIGETAFEEFCHENGVKILHSPFRQDYRRLNGWDDFVILVNGEPIRVEVKTQRVKRVDNVREVYYNTDQYQSKTKHDYCVVFVAVNKTLTRIAILGWIPAEEIKNYPVKNLRFTPAYAVPAEDLLNFDFLFNLKNVRRW